MTQMCSKKEQRLNSSNPQNKLNIECNKITNLIDNFINNDTFISNLLKILLIDISSKYKYANIIIYGGFLRELYKYQNIDKMNEYLKENNGDIDIYLKLKPSDIPFIYILIYDYIDSNSNINSSITYHKPSKYNFTGQNDLYTFELNDLVDNKKYKIDITISKNKNRLYDSSNFDTSINALCYNLKTKKLRSKDPKKLLLNNIFDEIKHNKFRIIPNKNKYILVDRILKLIYERLYKPDYTDQYTKYYMLWLSINLSINYYSIISYLHKYKKKVLSIEQYLEKNKQLTSNLLYITFNKFNILKCIKCELNTKNFNNVYCTTCEQLSKNKLEDNLNIIDYCDSSNFSEFFILAVIEDNLELLKLLWDMFDINKLNKEDMNLVINYCINKPKYHEYLKQLKDKIKSKSVILSCIIKNDKIEIFNMYCDLYVKKFDQKKNYIFKYTFNYNSLNIIKHLSQIAKINDFNDKLFGKICFHNNLDIIKIYLNSCIEIIDSYIINPKNRVDFIKQDQFCENISSKCNIDIIKYLTNLYNLKYNSNCIRKFIKYNNLETFEKSKFVEYFVRNLNNNNLICSQLNTLNYNDIYCTIIKFNYICYPLLFDFTKGLKSQKYLNMLKIAEYYIYNNRSKCNCKNCCNSQEYNIYNILAMSLTLFAKGLNYNFIINNVSKYFIKS